MHKAEEDQGARTAARMFNLISGAALGLVICLIILLVASFAVASGYIGEDLMYQLATAACFVGACLGSLLAVRRSKSRALVTGILTGIVMFLLMLVIGILAYSNMDTGEWGAGFLLASILGGVAGSILGTRRKKRRK